MSLTHNEAFHTETFNIASAVGFGAAVQLSASQSFVVLPASGASIGNAPVYGLAQASGPTPGQQIAIQTGGWAKGVAAASLGQGALVGAGIGTTSLVPIGASGHDASNAGLNAGPRWAIGRSLEAAAAGAIFTVTIFPQEVV